MRRIDPLSAILGRPDNSESQNSTDRRRYHAFRRITGYHNAIDSTLPPDYDLVATRPAPARTYDALPPYSCSVAQEGVVQMRMERPDPFHKFNNAVWEHVHIRLQGTLLHVSTAKQHGLFTHASKRGQFTGEPGKLIRSYTLQHAEVGLASDFKKYEIIPKSPMALLLPESALKQLYESDPDAFICVFNHVARVRLEEVQLCFRFGSTNERAEWMDALCAAIDISPPLEARSEPRNHTLPRRRRRHREAAAAAAALAAAAAAEGQEAVAANQEANDSAAQGGADTDTNGNNEQGSSSGAERSVELREVETVVTADGDDDGYGNGEEGDGDGDGEGEAEVGDDGDVAENARATEQDQDPDRDDLDLAFMRSAAGPSTATVMSPDEWGNAPWKDDPPAAMDPAREARYRRRCMPVLVNNSKYANDIIMHKSKRVVIDWENQTFLSYPPPPPPYSRASAGNVAKAASENNGEASPSSNLRKILRQASAVGETRGLVRFLSKDAIPEHSNEATAPGQSSDDHGPSAIKETGNWGKRIKALASTRSNEEPSSPVSQTITVQSPVIADEGLIPASPARGAFEPLAPPPERSHDKVSRLLGPDAPSSATGRSSPPVDTLTHRSSHVSVEPDTTPMHTYTTQPPVSKRRALPRKASSILSSISTWPHSPKAGGSIRINRSTSTNSTSASSAVSARPNASVTSLTSSTAARREQELPRPASPSLSTSSSSRPPLSAASELRARDLFSSVPDSPVSPLVEYPLHRPRQQRSKPSPIVATPSSPAIELSAAPRTPRSISSPAQAPATARVPDLSIPQKRMTAETGLIPVPIVAEDAPPLPAVPKYLTTPPAGVHRSVSAASELPASAPTSAPRTTGLRRALTDLPSAELPGTPGPNPVAAPLASTSASASSAPSRSNTSLSSTSTSVATATAAAPAKPSPAQRDFTRNLHGLRDDLAAADDRPGVKRTQTSDGIPTRPRHQDKALRTLGLVS